MTLKVGCVYLNGFQCSMSVYFFSRKNFAKYNDEKKVQ